MSPAWYRASPQPATGTPDPPPRLAPPPPSPFNSSLADDPRSQQAVTNESLNFLFFSSCSRHGMDLVAPARVVLAVS